jgi:hypothetical protein
MTEAKIRERERARAPMREGDIRASETRAPVRKRKKRKGRNKGTKRKRALPSRFPVPGQRLGSVHQACAYAGIGRSKLYELGGKHPGLMKKIDGKTVVDFPLFDSILDALPNARISASS